MLVQGLVKDVVVCITASSVVPLMLARRVCRDRLCELKVRVALRARTQHVFASMTFGTGCWVKAVTRAPTQSTFSSLKSSDTSLMQLHGVARSHSLGFIVTHSFRLA